MRKVGGIPRSRAPDERTEPSSRPTSNLLAQLRRVGVSLEVLPRSINYLLNGNTVAEEPQTRTHREGRLDQVYRALADCEENLGHSRPSATGYHIHHDRRGEMNDLLIIFRTKEHRIRSILKSPTH